MSNMCKMDRNGKQTQQLKRVNSQSARQRKINKDNHLVPCGGCHLYISFALRSQRSTNTNALDAKHKLSLTSGKQNTPGVN